MQLNLEIQKVVKKKQAQKHSLVTDQTETIKGGEYYTPYIENH